MKNLIKHLYVCVSIVRFLPILLLCFISPNKNIIKYDIDKWGKCYGLNFRGGYLFLWLLVFYREFRSLIYYRCRLARIFKAIAPPMTNLFINCENIGKGLFIQHGFSTIISAKSIGNDCWINQQVTIGWTSSTDAPIIGNNVKIYAGAIVIGNVHVGDNVRIGAGAVVVKDIEDNATVVGAPCRVIQQQVLHDNQY